VTTLDGDGDVEAKVCLVARFYGLRLHELLVGIIFGVIFVNFWVLYGN
jgi:hypothetical protein